MTGSYLPNINLSIDEKKLLERLEAFPKQYNRAIIKALNRAGKGVVNNSINIIASRYNIKKSRLKRTYDLRLAKDGRLYAHAIFKDYKYMHITDFGGKQTAKGVTYKILKKGKRQLYRGAFIAKGRVSGKMIAFRRLEKTSYPISHIITTAGTTILKDKRIQKELQLAAANLLKKNLLHEAKYRLDKLEA